MRTEARTPMQWTAGVNAGFSSAPAEKLYLPVEADLSTRTVGAQEADPASLLNTFRALAALRRAHPALHNDSAFQVVYAEAGRYPFAFLRHCESEQILVAVNPADRAMEVALAASQLEGSLPTPLTLWGVESGLTRTLDGWRIALPPVSAGIYQV